MNEQNTRKPYPTDLTDAEWQRIAPALPELTPRRGRHRVYAYWEMLNAIFAIVRSGCAWRMRPHDMPPWKTVSHSVRFWQRDGTWVRIHAALRTDVRVAAGREAAPSAAILDSQSVTTTENGGRTGLMLATTSTDAHAICWWIPWAWW